MESRGLSCGIEGAQLWNRGGSAVGEIGEVDFACTSGTETKRLDLSAFSTLESATYSPWVSLTRSFLRSIIWMAPDDVYWPTSPVQK